MDKNDTKQREKLKLTAEQARNILHDDVDPPEFEVVQDKVTGKRRWLIDHRLVIKRISDGKFFAGHYSVGATEQQDECAWEYDTPDFTEVFPTEKTIIVYV